MNPLETATETATRLGFDLNSNVTEAQMNTYFAERAKVETARASAAAAASAPPPPPPSPDDLLGQARLRAQAIRDSEALRADLETVLLSEDRNGLSADEVADLTLTELRQAVGIDPTPEQEAEAEANDYAANLAALQAEPESFGSDAWKTKLAAHLDSTDTKPYSTEETD